VTGVQTCALPIWREINADDHRRFVQDAIEQINKS
jgi:hypothetical protein